VDTARRWRQASQAKKSAAEQPGGRIRVDNKLHFTLETAMDCPRKALKRAKTYTCEEVQTHPQGERMISQEPFIFAAFRAFRGLQSRI
jgi:hypothetical protein